MHWYQGLSGELVNVLREAKQVVPESLLKFGTHVKKKVRHTLLIYNIFAKSPRLVFMYISHAISSATLLCYRHMTSIFSQLGTHFC